jgi:putative oxidoreductase
MLVFTKSALLMKTSINRLSRFTRNRALGLLLIRLGTGLVFFMHGWSKINNLSGVEGMFMHLGLGGPTGIFIAYLEVIGGLCLILGIFTRVFGVAFGIEMLVAVFIMGVPTSYQPHELELFLMLVSFGIALAGSGNYSLWKMECDLCGGMLCKADLDCPGK